MDSDGFKFDQLQAASDLVTRIWEAGALYCLRDQPMRYTDIGNWLAAWSGQRPSDSAITRALKRLDRGGFVMHKDGHEVRRGTYAITSDGRARIAKIAALTGTLDEDD
jgi:DNA-binding PadR family transcriptional regulator